MDSNHLFHIADYIVFALTIVISLGIGIYFALSGKRQATNVEYLLGGRNMKVLPVAISILVTFISTIGILGTPAEVYVYGTQFFLVVFAHGIGTVIGAFVFVPLFYPLRLTSTFEYQALRFKSQFTEISCCIITLFNALLFNGIMIFSPCVAFEAVSGCPLWASMVICGVSATIYTTVGGMKAVVWTDVFQAALIFIGLVSVVVLGTIKTGGVVEVWKINDQWNHLQFFNFSFDPRERLTFWNVVFVNALLWMTLATSQPCVQRYCSLPTLKDARNSLLIMIFGFTISVVLNCACGVTAFAYYAKQGCDPILSGKLKNPNQILPYFVMDVMNYPPVPGIFIACLFSASLSSLSSALNGMAAMTWQNILRYKYHYLSETRQAQVSKLCTLVYGVISIGIAFLVKEIGGTLIQITYSILGGIGGPILGTIVLGALWPRAGPKSTMIATFMALAICLWISVGSSFNRVFDPPIGGPVDQCYAPTTCGGATNWTVAELTLQNGTSCDLMMEQGAFPSLSAEPNGTLAGPAEQSQATMTTASDPLPPWIRWLYSVSYFYYPLIGMLLVLIIGMILSLIPGMDMPAEDVPLETLFPWVASSRACWSCTRAGQRHSLDVKPKAAANGDLEPELRPMIYKPHTMTTDNDADPWVLRDKEKGLCQSPDPTSSV